MTDRDSSPGSDGLTRRDRDLINSVLARYPDVRRVTLFGSRAMGTFGRGSDIDLALEGAGLDARTLTRIAAELEDSDLPYKVDLLLRDDELEPKLEAHIRRHGKPFGSGAGTAHRPNAGLGLTRERLASHVDLLTGFPFKSAAYTSAQEAIRLVRGDNVVQGGLRWDNAPRWPCPLDNGIDRYRLQAGDVILAMDRPWIDAGLKYARIRAEDVPSFLVQRVARLRAGASLDQQFLYYLIGSPAFTDHVLAVQTGTAVPHISSRQILEFEFCLPPLNKQRAIADVLGALDDKIEQNRRTARALERLARAIFRAWFVDFEPVKAKAAGATSFPGMPQPVFDAMPTRFVDSGIGPVPEGWAVESVYEFADVIYGAPFSSKLFNDQRNGHPLIRIRDLQTHEPTVSTPEHHPNGTLIQAADIVIGMDGEFRLHYWTGTAAWLNQRVCTFKPKAGIPRMFLGESLRGPLAHFERAKTGTTVIHLGKADIDTFRLVQPEARVLEAFGEVTGSLLECFVHMARESRSLAEMRGYLLPKLLSGEVRVTVTGTVTEGCE